MDKFAEIDKLALNFNSLPKKERKRLKHQLERRELEEQKKKGSIIKWIVIGIVVIAVGFAGWWIVKELSKPLPGQQFPSQGREHVKEDVWSKFSYNSNPPTSGLHDGVWTRAGIYDTPQGDGYLVHSLEHGYIILSYNCNSGISNFSSKGGSASGGQFPISNKGTPSGEATQSGVLPSPLNQQDCDLLIKQLSDLANEKRLWKLIVVPREKLEVRLAVAAWTRLDKMNEFNKDRITAFIDAHRDHGPEKTME